MPLTAAPVYRKVAFLMKVTVISRARRLRGLDLARGLALLGMVIVNFELAMESTENGPDWLSRLTSSLQGRAAGTFVLLAGIGASLGSARARLATGPEAPAVRRKAQRTLFLRGLFLFAIGTPFLAVWPADILHFYGVYLSIGALLLFASTRVVWSVIAAVAAAGLVFLGTADYAAHWNFWTLTYRDLWSPMGFLRNLIFDGWHPVIPWVAIYLCGLWIGRMPLGDTAVRKRLGLFAALGFALTTGFSWGLAPQGIESEGWRALFAPVSFPPTPTYLIAAVSTALLVILGCLWFIDRYPDAPIKPIEAVGKLALTVYVAHVFVGMGTLEAIGKFEGQPLWVSVFAAFVFFEASALFALLWLKKFKRGPLEACMRGICG